MFKYVLTPCSFSPALSQSVLHLVTLTSLIFFDCLHIVRLPLHERKLCFDKRQLSCVYLIYHAKE